MFSRKKISVLKCVVLWNITVIYDMRTASPVDKGVCGIYKKYNYIFIMASFIFSNLVCGVIHPRGQLDVTLVCY